VKCKDRYCCVATADAAGVPAICTVSCADLTAASRCPKTARKFVVLTCRNHSTRSMALASRQDPQVASFFPSTHSSDQLTHVMKSSLCMCPPYCAACTGTPSTTSPAIPQYSAWECSDTASGSKCSAKCAIGYTAQTATSWASTCTAGTWSIAAADGTDQSLVCRPNCKLLRHSTRVCASLACIARSTCVFAWHDMLLQ
jgi:hypothetical protein